MPQWGQPPLWIPTDSFYIELCRFSSPFCPPRARNFISKYVAQSIWKGPALYWVTRYTGLCKTRTVSPGETKDNRTFLSHCAAWWQVGQTKAKILGDVGLGRTLTLETLSAHSGGGMRGLADEERRAPGSRDIVELSETSSSLTRRQRLWQKAAWWGLHCLGTCRATSELLTWTWSRSETHHTPLCTEMFILVHFFISNCRLRRNQHGERTAAKETLVCGDSSDNNLQSASAWVIGLIRGGYSTKGSGRTLKACSPP